MWLYDSTDQTWHFWTGSTPPPPPTPALCGHPMSVTVGPVGVGNRCDVCRRIAAGG